MRIQPVSGDLLVEIAIGIAAFAAVYYLAARSARAAQDAVTNAAQDLIEVPGQWADSIKETLTYQRPDPATSPWTATLYDANELNKEMNPLNPVNWYNWSWSVVDWATGKR